MKNALTIACLFLVTPFLIHAQKTDGRIKFSQGQEIGISMKIKTHISQEAMGQSFDFDLDGSSIHNYKVTNATEDNFTLHHSMKQITFNFDGMGQKRNFDSDKERDMTGTFGKPVKEMLDKSFDMIIDPSGKVLMVQPDKVELTAGDPRLAIITNMLKDVVAVVQPPKKGGSSFFKILPGYEVGKGDSWADTVVNEHEKSIINYKVADISDSTINVDVTGFSVTTSKAEMMGNETTTTMNNKYSGKISIDRASGIIKEKSVKVESSGSTEISGGSLPVTSTTTIETIVN